MRLILLALTSLMLTSATAGAEPDRAARWWNHVRILASDEYEGRAAGSPGYDRAADYVAEQFRQIGLRPAGTDGYRQRVAFTQQTILPERSSAALIGERGRTPLAMPADLILSGAGGPVPERIDAPLVFAGYGLRLPEAGHDDFAGLELGGKIVVVLSGGPAKLSGALKSHARSERARWLAGQGAVGLIQLVTPGQVEIPWERRIALAAAPALYFEDASLRDSSAPFFNAQFDPARSKLLFDGSGKDWRAIAAAADASAPVPAFALALRLQARVAAQRIPLASDNIIAVLPGSDPDLAHEHVVLSAHLDGYGIGTPIRGDAIYNGALDNASGVASLIEIARTLKARRDRPRRSILFAIVTAEEKGLLGARYFAARPTVPKQNLVANLNFDMALPIFPLVAVTPIGHDQSTLGQHAKAVSWAMKLPIWPDPFPERNTFTRSDQYAFIRQGIPALFFKFGFKAGSRQAEAEKTWRATLYHSPFDDANQPVMPAEAVRLNDYAAAIALRVANAQGRPSWNADSFFRRFGQ